MESTSSTKNKIELIQNCVQQLIESKQASSVDSDEEHQLLSKLLSQLEALKSSEVVNPSESEELNPLNEVGTKSKDEADKSADDSEAGAEAVAEELKKLKKQNKVTHWLMSALILLTVAWQLSEVSLLLKLKEGVTHPFRSFGNMVAGVVKRPKLNDFVADNQPFSAKKNEDESILKLPPFELTDMIQSSNDN